MNRSKFIIFFIILVLSLPFTYGGCVLVFTTGDVNKERDPDTGEPSTDFDGRTAQATIDSTNARDLSDGAFSGGITGFEAESAGFTEDSMTTQIGAFWPLRLPLVLKDSLQKIEIASTEGGHFKPAVETKSGTLQGSCGGRLSYSIYFIRDTKTFGGSISLENYCYHRITISGETDVDGSYGVGTGDFSTARFSFSNLADDYITWDGELSMDFMQQPLIATFSAYRKDIESGQVYWLKDYSMNLTEFVGFIELEIFGSFYHPDHGYVNLATLEPFIVHHEDDWPTSGQLTIKGENNTQAELNVLDHVTYAVDVDTDGDGGFDWKSGILNWADM